MCYGGVIDKSHPTGLDDVRIDLEKPSTAHMSAKLACSRLDGRPESATPCCLCDKGKVNILLLDVARKRVFVRKREKTPSFLAVGLTKGVMDFRAMEVLRELAARRAPSKRL